MKQNRHAFLSGLTAVLCAAMLLTGCGSEPLPSTEPIQTNMPAETTEPAASCETNFLMMDEGRYEGNTMEEQIDNASQKLVLGSKITRDQIRTETFLDTLSDTPSSAWDVSNGTVGPAGPVLFCPDSCKKRTDGIQ